MHMEAVGAVAFGWLLMLLIWGAGILGSLALMGLWIWALVDCVRREFPGANDKVTWVLVICLANWLGAIIYLALGRPQGRLPEEAPPRPG